MSEDCTCGTTNSDRTTTHEATGIRDEEPHEATVIRDEEPLEATLPEDVDAAFGRLLGGDPIPTLGAWAERMRQGVDETDGIGIENLCHADGETAHWGEVDGERYHFICFYDAVVLAALTDGAVDVRTESPEGTVVEAHAVGTDELTVSPEGTMFSIGVADDIEAPADGDLTNADIYAAVCPYVKAFPSVDAYERWAEDVAAATVAMPLSGATELAAALVD